MTLLKCHNNTTLHVRFRYRGEQEQIPAAPQHLPLSSSYDHRIAFLLDGEKDQSHLLLFLHQQSEAIKTIVIMVKFTSVALTTISMAGLGLVLAAPRITKDYLHAKVSQW